MYGCIGYRRGIGGFNGLQDIWPLMVGSGLPTLVPGVNLVSKSWSSGGCRFTTALDGPKSRRRPPMGDYLEMQATSVLIRAFLGAALGLGWALAWPEPAQAASKQSIGATKCTYQVGYQLCLGDCKVTATYADGTKRYRCKQYQCDLEGNCTTNGTEQEYVERKTKPPKRPDATRSPTNQGIRAPN